MCLAATITDCGSILLLSGGPNICCCVGGTNARVLTIYEQSISSALNPDTYFKMSQVTNSAITDALQSVDKIKLDYTAARSRADAERTAREREMQAMQQHLLRDHYAREMMDRNTMDQERMAREMSAARFASSSYTEQLMARSDPQIFQPPEHADGPYTHVRPETSVASHLPSRLAQPLSTGSSNVAGAMLGPFTATRLFVPPESQ
jgi:hypothetical protein